MPGDDYNLLLTIQNQLGSLDAKVSDLKEDMSTICDFKEEVGRIAQDFLSYKASRQALPDRVNVLEQKTTSTEKALAEHIATTAWIAERVAKSDTYFKAAMIAWGIIVSIVGLLITFHLHLVITFVMK